MYRVNEIFHSLQGEGINAGRAAIFIRLSGCNLKCPFCDTDFKSAEEMSVLEIKRVIIESVGTNPMPSLCVITGGEPTLQLESSLIVALHQMGIQVAMESNGTHEAPVGLDYITISPKSPFVKNGECKVTECTEVQVVMTETICDAEICHFENIKAKYYYLQPCDTGDEKKNKVIMQRCVEFIKAHPNWVLSLQQQKILNVR